MTRKKGKKVDEEDVEIVDTEDTELPPDIEKLIGELGSNKFSIQVHRITSDGNMEKIGSFLPDSFNADLIAEKYGGGRFKFSVKDEKGRYVSQSTVMYAKPIMEIKTEGKDDSQKEMISLLRDELKASKEDSKSTNVAMINMMSKVLEVQMNTNSKPQVQPNVIDEVTKIVGLLNLNKQANPMENITNVMKLLTDGMKIGKDSADLSGDKSPTDMIMMKLADQFLPLLTKLKDASANRSTSTLPLIPTVLTPPVQPQIQELPKMEYKTETEKQVIETLRTHGRGLIDCANIGSEHSFVVNLILSKLQDSDIDKIFDYYNGDTAEENIQRTFVFIPDFAKHDAWFRELLKGLFQAITPEPEGEINNETGTDTENKDGELNGSDSSKTGSDSERTTH